MGGMSFMCPICKTWTLSQRSMRDHWSGKHGLKNVKFEGVGPAVRIIECQELIEK